MSSRLRIAGIIACLVLPSLAAPGGARAQSLTSAGLNGVVRDTRGQPLYQVSITIVETSSGIRKAASTDRSGQFRASLLRPGQYDVVAEAIGYRPKRVRNVPVVPGNEVHVGIVIEAAPPPVNRIDTVFFPGTAISGRASGMSQRFPEAVTREIADRRRDVTEALRYASNVTQDQIEGFPQAEPVTVIDGVPFVSARHPAVASRSPAGLALPLLAVDRVELATNPVDVEWARFASGFLATDTRHGSNDWRADLYGDWAGRPTSKSKYFDTQDVDHNSWRAGGVVSGPLIRDTASFALGIEHRQVENPFPAIASTDSAAAIVALASSISGQDLSAYRHPYVSSQTATSGFGRVDWQIAANHLITSRVSIGKLEATPADFAIGSFRSLGAQLSGTDISASATVTSRFSTKTYQDFRLGFSESRREYGSAPLPSTVVVDPALALGSDPSLPGGFKRTSLFLSDALHFELGRHALKFGVQADVGIFNDGYAFGRDPHFVYGDSTRFAQLQGLFWQTGGATPIAKFTIPDFAGFLQDAWTVAPGVTLTAGVRYDLEKLPVSKVVPNDSLFFVTGLANILIPSKAARLSPRLGFAWDAGSRGEWIVRGAAGMYTQPFDPASFSEVITSSFRVDYRSALGALPGWPAAPGTAVAPGRGRDVTVFGPDPTSPREIHFTLGLSHALGSNTALHLSGTYRHDDYLLRRHDLNLPAAPSTRDANGRLIYGALQQLGDQLAPVPGSNVRFPTYNRIWALDPDGFSDYRGASIGLERSSSGGIGLLATYTYSETRDNWLSRPGSNPVAQVTPFASGANNTDWADGIGDFDVPHHVSVSIVLPEIRSLLGARLSAHYSYRSGYPFTPSYRQGVDANGDGSATNDPAYVNESIAGTSNLFSTWDCLRSQSGRFAERNSCRSEGVQQLDLRLSFAPIRTGTLRGELVLDVLNLLDSSDIIPDGAVYLVDATRTITTNASGVITVPLVVNPNFGHPLLRLTSGKSLRIGIRLTR